MAVDSESDVDFRNGIDSWLLLGVMARLVWWCSWKTTSASAGIGLDQVKSVVLTRTWWPTSSKPRIVSTQPGDCVCWRAME